jgi:hypothetical protein
MPNPSVPAARKKSRLAQVLEDFHDALTIKPPGFGFNAAQKVVFWLLFRVRFAFFALKNQFVLASSKT